MTTRSFGNEGFKQFLGVVADIRDPKQLGRVKVRVFNMHDNTNDISDEDLPWAHVMMSPMSASLSGVGFSPTGLLPNSYVWGFFADGEEGQFPFVLGTWHKIPDMDPNKSDVNVLARGTNKIVKTKTGPEPDSAYSAQYPKNTVYESKSGHIIEIDDTDGEERIHIYHRKGTYVEIDKTGRIVIKSVDSSIDVTDKKKTIYAKDTILIQSEKSINLVAKDNITLSAKNVKISAGSTNMSMSSGVFGLNTGSMKMKGDYAKIDTPLSSVSGASVASGKINAKNVLASGISASKIKSKMTGGLSTGLSSMSKSFKGLGSLSSLPTLPDVTTALDGVFNELNTSLESVAGSIGNDKLNQIDNTLNQLDSIQSSIDSAVNTLDSQIDIKLSVVEDQINNKTNTSILQANTSSIVSNLLDSTSEVWG